MKNKETAIPLRECVQYFVYLIILQQTISKFLDKALKYFITFIVKLYLLFFLFFKF